MTDEIEKMGKSLLRHDHRDGQAVLMYLDPGDAPGIVADLERVAISRGYTKVCARIPAAHARHFVAAGYQLEAAIPHFYGEGDTGCFMTRFFVKEQMLERAPMLRNAVLATTELQPPAPAVTLAEGGTLRLARAADVDRVAALYGEVGVAKSAAVHDPRFLEAALNRGDLFLGVWVAEAPVAICAAHLDAASGSGELAHFAVNPQHRGRGHALLLLQGMAQALSPLGVRLLWSAVRAYAPGINITFARGGYCYGGTLTNSTNIYGTLESVNVWYKALGDDPALAWGSVFPSSPA
ncbi:hypothetical protein M1B72_20455 [Geomonas paludis]|uniref:N-acetyltransferase domain-containing protein n=1 Tax=Geomonas paludis TaxID=2740185 RepID=A0A6V8MR95_9BACT|nr:GNAT family N-acetyltransferase [Geomonas paludis]UPU35785.1 hypothetical protein M1B72_20455 [Geomonas paludis]GFO62635.1 hypothetical protein GMPD_05540 [Geomonas paludis]